VSVNLVVILDLASVYRAFGFDLGDVILVE